MLDSNPLHTPTPANDLSYRGVFIGVGYGPRGRHAPDDIRARLLQQIDDGRITWRFAMIAEARYTRRMNRR